MKSLLQEFSGNNFLLTCDNWFVAPDGRQYRSVWGRIEIYDSEKTLGVKTNVKSTNWYVIVGEQGKRVIIAGCQVHYACVCMDKPNTGRVQDEKFVETAKENVSYDYRTMIYLAQ